MKQRIAWILSWIAFSCLSTSAFAMTPSAINYQGRLLDGGGQPVNGAVDVRIDIYAAQSGGSPSYTEVIGVVPVEDGIYSFHFGENGVNLVPGLATNTINAVETMGVGDGIDKFFPYTASNAPINNPSVVVTDGTHNWNDVDGSVEPRFEVIVNHGTGDMSVEYRMDLPAPSNGTLIQAFYWYNEVVSITISNPVPLMPTLMQPEAWLEVSMNGDPLQPRERIVAVPYAVRSAEVDKITSSTVFDNGVVSSAAMAAGAVGNEQLARAYASGAIPMSDLVTHPSDLGINAQSNQLFTLFFDTTPVISLIPVAAEFTGADGLVATAKSISQAGFSFGLSGNFFAQRTIFYESRNFLEFATINGKPACSFSTDVSSGKIIHYLQADDSLGASWREPVVVTFKAGIQPYSLAEIGGRPAIVYRDIQDLNFVRALDADGTAWGSPETAFVGGSINEAWLIEVNGRPAIAHDGGTPDSIRYTRALNSQGSLWGPSVVITNDLIIVGFEIVNGNPAIGAEGPRVFRAVDQDGAIWGQTTILGTINADASFTVVSGHPAFAYTTNDVSGAVDMTRKVVFQRANDASGSVWGPAVELYASTEVAEPRLVSTTTGPSVFFRNRFLWAVRAQGASGSNWGEPRMLNHASGIKAAIVSGEPAFITQSTSPMQYFRNISADKRSLSWLAVEP
jgi:hypothetical protein